MSRARDGAGRLAGRVAIVTGGSGGIGRATCVALAREGARVVLVGRDPTRLQHALAEIGRQAPGAPPLGLSLDVGREADMDTMARQTVERFGRIDILVACAGIARSPGSPTALPRSLAQLTSREWDDVVTTNLTGTFLSNRAVLPAMTRQRSGTIVNVASSPAGVAGQPFAAAYCASKFAVVGLSEALAEEVAEDGIRVEVLFPDLVDTPLVRDTTLAARLGPSLPAERVAEVVVYLVTLPEDTVLTGSRRLGYPVVRRLPGEPAQWAR